MEPDRPGLLEASGRRTVTLRRTPFLSGIAAVALTLVVLIGLWQNAEGDDAGPPATTTTTTATTTSLPDPTVALEAEIADLEGRLRALDDELAAQPAPSLAGSMLHRIPVVAGSTFVAALESAVAVVGSFGGYSLVSPETDTVVASGTVSDRATRVVPSGTSLWVTNSADSEVVRIQPLSGTINAPFSFPGPDGLAVVGDSLLVAAFEQGFLGKVDPETGEIVARLALDGKPTDVKASDDHGVWVALVDTGELVRIDPDEMTVLARVLVGAGPVGIGFTDDGVWSANGEEGTVTVVDSDTAELIDTVTVGDGPTELVGAGGSVWVTVTDAGELVEIDPVTREIVSRTPLGGPGIGGGPVGITAAAGSLWVGMDGEKSVVRVALPD